MMKNAMNRKLPIATMLGALSMVGVKQAAAYDVIATDKTHLNAEFLGVLGYFDSPKNYAGGDHGVRWTEGFAKYGFRGDHAFDSVGTVFGALNVVSSGTWGDGDAAGFTDGSERETDVEDAFIGWRSGKTLSSLGDDGLEVSVGRQVIHIGDGFIVNDDGLNLGNGIPGGDLNRGGAYYLAARRAFDETAVVKIGGEQGFKAHFIWFASDNIAQAKTEMAISSLGYANKAGELEFSYFKGLDVDDKWADSFLAQRDGMEIYSIRGAGDAGVDNANFAFEYAIQDKTSGHENAWYLEAGYTFAEAPWSPNLTYRYSRYSDAWDNLFTGFSRGYGTWFQGEVAANYSGPFNTNTGIHHIGLTLTPSDTVTIGALAFQFDTVDQNVGPNLDAHELDLYLDWAAHDTLTVSPLVGLYKPAHSAAEGGSQNDDDLNVYGQIVVALAF